MEIHVTKRGEQWGPYTLEEINEQLAEGSLTANEQAWHEGLEAWIPLTQLAGIRVPSLPPRRVGGPRKEEAFQFADGPFGDHEKVLWEGSASHWLYFWQYVWGILTLPLLVGIVILAGIPLARAKRRYRVTNKRVSMATGLLNRTSAEVRIQDIRSITVQRSGISGLFGIGTVHFGSAGTADVEVSFAGIPNAEDVKRMVSRLQ